MTGREEEVAAGGRMVSLETEKRRVAAIPLWAGLGCSWFRRRLYQRPLSISCPHCISDFGSKAVESHLSNSSPHGFIT